MHIPSAVKLHRVSKTLELQYPSGECFVLPAEFLRVYSPSAEVQGHGKPILQSGKLNVGLQDVKPAGQYALKLVFDDGHDSGLFSWNYLYELGSNQQSLWQQYLAELHAAGKSRDPDVQVVQIRL